jgi:hypothetical protein
MLPHSAFSFTVENQPGALIYCSELSATSAQEAKQACRIKCARPDILAQVQGVFVSLLPEGSFVVIPQLRSESAPESKEAAFGVLD